MTRARIDVPQEKIAEFCRRHRIKRLSLFGSVLRDDFTDESDVDVLVEFEEGAGSAGNSSACRMSFQRFSVEKWN
jgi:predicted nucleotidyltransferase